MERELKRMEGKKDGEPEHRAKFTFKGTAKAISLAHRLSPKAQRKKDKSQNASQLKVTINLL